MSDWRTSGAQNRSGRDEKLLEVLCRHLELDERGYNELVAEMWQRSCSKRFDRLFRVPMAWFERVPEINGDILTWSKARVLTW